MKNFLRLLMVIMAYQFSLSITTVFGQQVKLGWNLSENPSVRYYGIYRATHKDSALTLLTQVTHPENQYIDRNVVTGKYYGYAATAIDESGNESNFSNRIDTTIATTTPVELSLFIGQVNANQVNLVWKTESESNNFGFEIEKRTNFETKSKKIGFINGKGTTTMPQEYKFVDENVEKGTYYYRLKQIDFDAKFEYSPEIKIVVNIPDEYQLFQNYPNPFNPKTTIAYNLAEAGHVKITIYDITGREIQKVVDKMQEAGHYEFDWDAKNYQNQSIAGGVYYYKLETPNFTQFRKMLLLK
ncbi:T9SS type A sorting domain-containing protein [candidate division KSB1 bacterium]|nr:T9SS type A sorting domain-containing protein [candidate division KSB1 bacterium]